MELDDISMPRRKPLALQLAPMIDIFTLIIVFLLKSTVVSDIALVFPSDLEAPLSSQIESLESYPEIFVYKDRIEVPFLELKKSLSSLKSISPSELEAYRVRAEKYRKQADGFSKSTVININLLAGRDNNYQNIFDSVKFLRQLGFQSIQFIAESESVQ
jgi:hypothetical protein